MKTFISTALLIFIIGTIGAVDIDSHQFIDHIRGVSKPGSPELFEDGVIFTAPSTFQRVGIAFAHEQYARVHWFRKLMLPRTPAELGADGEPQKDVETEVDSGILFHVENIPADLENMDYRLVIGGLWTADPLNPVKVFGPMGIAESRVVLPAKPEARESGAKPGAYRFSYRAEEGETVTVGGSFNNWDPFMYELAETSPGFYSLTLPLPPGTYQYVFFYRGERIPDPLARRLYSPEGRVISEASVPES